MMKNGLADMIYNCFKHSEEFTLKEAYKINKYKSKETIRARIYDNSGIKFKRIAKEIYRTLGGNDEACIVMEGE